MNSKKTFGLLFLLLFLFTGTSFAEGQSGIGGAFSILFDILFFIYTGLIGGLILIIRKLLKLEISTPKVLIAFGIGLMISILFYVIDSSLFLTLFWTFF